MKHTISHPLAVRPETIAKLRQLLEQHLGPPLPWSDDEIRQMALDLMHMFAVLAAVRLRGKVKNEPHI